MYPSVLVKISFWMVMYTLLINELGFGVTRLNLGNIPSFDYFHFAQSPFLRNVQTLPHEFCSIVTLQYARRPELCPDYRHLVPYNLRRFTFDWRTTRVSRGNVDRADDPIVAVARLRSKICQCVHHHQDTAVQNGRSSLQCNIPMRSI